MSDSLLPLRWIFLFSFLTISLWGQIPKITEHPLSQIAIEGDSLSVTVTATSAEPLTYTWLHNGARLAETTGTLFLPHATLADRGWYHVTVSNASGSATSVFMVEVGLPESAFSLWGEFYGTTPSTLNNVVTLTSGFDSITLLALQADGTVSAWGGNSQGQASVPTDLAPAVRIATNAAGSAAVTASGQIIEWPATGNLPSDLTDIVDVKLGRYYGLALKADGTVVSWGENFNSQANVPSDLNNVVGIATGIGHSAALLANGTVRAWGGNAAASSVPADLQNVVSLTGGSSHLLAHLADGSIVTWGNDYDGSTTVPSDLSFISEISGGGNFNLLRHTDGTVSGFGSNYQKQLDVPAHLSGAVKIVTGFAFSGVLLSPALPQIETHPAPQTLATGDNLLLSVEPSGTIPFTFQWFLDDVALTDGDNIEGATSAELAIFNLTSAHAGNYHVEVTNPYATVSSTPSAVTVATLPVFTTRPLSQLLGLGENATFTATVSAPGAVTYAWKHNGQLIPGATSASLTVTDATTSDAGTYEIIATDDQGSNSSVFHVHLTPSIPGERTLRFWGTAFHQQDNIPTGSTNIVKLVVHDNRVLALHADGTVSGWGAQSFDTAPPTGLTNVVDIAAGPYASAALTADGRVTSWGNYFDQDWTVTKHLTNVVALSASSMRLVAVKNNGTVWSSYGDQDDVSFWTEVVSAVPHLNGIYGIRRDGTFLQTGELINDFDTNIPQPIHLENLAELATDRNYAIARFRDGSVTGWGRNSYDQARPPQSIHDTIAINPDYALHQGGLLSEWGVGANGIDSPIYDLADVLTFDSHDGYGIAVVAARAPTFPASAEPLTVNLGKFTTLAPSVKSGPNASYQWTHDGQNIDGATDPTLQLDGLTTDADGDYVLHATNAYGTTSSAPISLQVVPPVTVTDRPLSRMISTGDDTTFSITATGQGDLHYEWRHNGELLPSVTGPSLTITDATRENRGRYELLITDSVGGTAFSIVYLEVAPPVGALIGWGFSDAALPGAPHNFAAVAASGSSGIGLRADGTVESWAYANFPPPADLDNIVAVASGQNYALALKADGTVTAWPTYQYSTPPTVPTGLDNVVAIAANHNTNLALCADGTVVAWTSTSNQIGDVPVDLDEVVSISAGIYQAMALRRDHSVVSWGTGPIHVSRPVRDIAAGWTNVLLRLDDGIIEHWQSGTLAEFKSALNLPEVRAMSVGSDQALLIDGENRLHSTDPSLVDSSLLTFENILDVASGQDSHVVLIGTTPVPPEITTPPLSQSIPYASSITLRVEVSGTPILRYQWIKDGSPLTGETAPTLTLTDSREEDSGHYAVEVSNGYGTTTSTAAELTVVVTRVSPDVTPVAGQSVTLSVNAPEATAYQWRFRGAPIAGATGSTLTLDNLSRAQNGFYDVVLTTSTGDEIAHAHQLDVTPAIVPDIMVADPDFAPRFEREGLVDINVVAPLSDGSFLVGGDFTTAGDLPIAYLARFLADGTLDSSYQPPVLNGPVNAIHVAADGRVYVGGDFTYASGRAQGRLLRLTSDLTFDFSFGGGSGFEKSVFVITIDDQGRILVGGELGDYQGTWVNGIARLTSDGQLETPIGALSYTDNVRTIHLLTDGKLMVGGGSINETNGFVAKLNADGTPDTTWSSYNGEISTGRTVYQLHPLSDGSWYIVGGYMGDLNQNSGLLLQKLKSDATWDHDSFEPDSSFSQFPLGLTTSTLLPNERLLIGGPFVRPTIINADGSTGGEIFPFQPWVIPCAFTPTSGTGPQVWAQVSGPIDTRFGKADLNADFTPVSDFTHTSFRRNARVFHALQTSPDTVLLRGEFTHVNGDPHAGLVQLTHHGEIDPSFTPATTWPLYDSGPMVRDGQQRILAHNGARLTRLLPNGTTDSSFNASDSNPGALTLTPDGGILVSNQGYSGDGTHFSDDASVHRLNSDGSLDPNFNIDFQGTVRSIDTQSTGNIVLGGNIQSMESTFTSGLQRIAGDGTWDQNYRTDSHAYPHLTPGPNDALFVVGEYDINSLRKLTRSGEVDQNFDYSGQADATAIIPLATGEFYRITHANYPQADDPSDVVGRHLPDGSLDLDFHVGGLDVGFTDLSNFILLDDGSLWLMGTNLTVNGDPRSGLMRLIPAEALAITSAPQTIAAELGSTATLSVEVSGSGPITYQWYRNKIAIVDATSSSLALTNLTQNDVADYTVTVTGPFASFTTDAVTLTGTNPPPAITTQPTSVVAVAGSPAILTVEASGTGDLTYQWHRFGYAIPGANSATFTVPESTRSDAGIYDVVVADGLSTTSSDAVRIDVAPRAYPTALEVDPSFAPRLETEGGNINAILSAPDDKFIISGAFTRFQGVPVPGLVRVDADCQVDSTFQPPKELGHVLPYTNVQDMATQVRLILPDGKLLVTRPLPYTAENGQRNELIRLLANGTHDSTFTASVGPRFIQKIARQPDGKLILIGTGPLTPTSSDDQRVYRLNTDGSVDASYVPVFTRFSEIVTPFGLTVQPSGKVVFVGNFDSVNGTTVSSLARLNADGSHDATFTTAGYSPGWVTSLIADPQGNIWLDGYVYDSENRPSYLTRLTPDGEWDIANYFFSNSGAPFSHLQWGPDGKLWISSQNGSGNSRSLIVWRMSAGGEFEQVVVPYAPANSPAFVPLSDGGAWVGANDAVIHYHASGDEIATIAQTSHSAGANQAIHGPSGTLYIIGNFTTVDGSARRHIARLLPTGALDPTFNPGSGFDISPATITVAPDGNLYVGGPFTQFDGQPVPKLVRLRADGTLDPHFNVVESGAYSGEQGPLTVLKDGRLLVHGHRCFLPDGTIDTSFSTTLTEAAFAFPSLGNGALLNQGGLIIQTDANGNEVSRAQPGFGISGMDVLPDGRLLIGGASPNGGYESNNAIVTRLLPADYRIDDAFNASDLPQRDGSIYPYYGAHLLAQTDGRAILWDIFGMYRLNPDGRIDDSFHQPAIEGFARTYNQDAASLLLLDDGRLLIADQDMVVDGYQRHGLVVLHNTDGVQITEHPADQSIIEGESLTLTVTIADPTGLAYQWFKDGIAIEGEIATTLEIAALTTSDVGSYTLAITGPQGTTHSKSAQVTVAPVTAPVFTTQPRDQSAPSGTNVILTVIATGAPTPTYQWKHNGNTINGATNPTLTLSDVTPAESGAYTVVATNRVGSATSYSARVTVFPSGMSANQTLNGVSLSSASVTLEIANTFSSPETITQVDWQVLLPVGWSFLSSTGDETATTRPSLGDTDLLEWSWTTGALQPLDFRYSIEKAGEPTADHELVTLLSVTTAGTTIEYLVQPDPLPLRPHHSADIDRDNHLSLRELLRVIELYNTRSGTTRTGRYRMQSDTETVDGFAPEIDQTAPGSLHFHSADTDRNSQLDLSELLRVIELYNTRSGTTRSGRYRIQPDSTDGFTPDP